MPAHLSILYIIEESTDECGACITSLCCILYALYTVSINIILNVLVYVPQQMGKV